MIDIARVNGAISGLLATHQKALEIKQVYDERALRRILCCDFEKVLHALVDVQSVDTEQLLRDVFFSDQPAVAQSVLPSITSRHLNHVGFEIFEPLDMVLQGFDYWIENLNRVLGQRITDKRFLRFPASQSFQKRVNAFVEIMCVWLQIDDRVLTLEFFDIARPLTHVPEAERSMIYHLNPQALLTNGWKSPHHRPAMQHWFRNDSIWHYSIPVLSRQAVQQLHDQTFAALSAEAPHYRLVYQAPVENQHDGSFHTKIINRNNGVELEFCHLSPIQHYTDLSDRAMPL